MNDKEKSIAERFNELFGSTAVGGDDEKLLETATKFAVQLSADQVRILSTLAMVADALEFVEKKEAQAKVLRSFIKNYIMYKQFHGSDFFAMRALDSISLRKFMGPNPISLDVVKRA